MNLITSQHAWVIVGGSVARDSIKEIPERDRVRGMQSFEASAELQPGWARFLDAWESMAPAQCAAPLA